MSTQIVAKWGNSLGIRIPIAIAKQVNLEEGTSVTFTVVEGSLVIKPERRKKYTLDELLEGMTLENVHEEVDLGAPIGNEIW
ncbi:AbrB/MazE/SpoVT family DNA-binding domain-containing protein [Phormidesmis priestleyi]